MDRKIANVSRLVPTRSTELLLECQKLASERLPSSLKTVLDQVDDALFELANKADNSQRQNLYFDAMRELRLKRDSIESRFINSFNKDFENSLDLNKASKRQSSAFAPIGELSLVESDEVEQSLALTNFVTSVRTKCKEQLFGLDRRIGHLMSRPDLADEDNPIGPKAIGSAFKSACSQLDADIEVKLTLFKLFDRYACNSIDQLYHALNTHLVRQDVLPTISTAPRQAGGGRRTRVIIEEGDERTEATGPDVFSTLQNLMTNSSDGGNRFGGLGFGAAAGQQIGHSMNGMPGANLGMDRGAAGATALNPGHAQNGTPSFGATGGSSAGAAGPIPAHGLNGTPGFGATGGGENGLPTASATIGTESLVDTLTLLQHGNLSGVANAANSGFDETQIQAGNVNVLRSLKTTGAIGTINQTDDLTLDIVSILFDYILDDRAIPDAMKALIGRLQIPMLKVALLDKALFSKKSHPARRLLDSLASAAVEWSDNHHGNDELYDVMDKIVRRIINEFDDDISLFEQAVEELEHYLVEEREAAERRSAESTRSLRTREQIVLAKMSVDDALNERISGLELRAFLRQFLLEYWRQLLIITHVEEGEGSEIWDDQLRTVDELVWSIQDKASAQERKALTEKLPQLLKKVKGGMRTLEMDPKVCSKFMSMLASVHVVSVKHSQEASLAERHLLRDRQTDEPLTEPATNNDDFIKQGLAKMFERNGVNADELEIDFDISAFDEDTQPPSEPEHLASNIMDFVDQVTQLDLGNWVEFDNDDGSTMRARFTWISPGTGRYLFTTRRGQKAVDTTLTGLADQFARNVARPIETQPDPIFDRAIGDLMNKLEGEPVS